jgi:hypothetical protein
VAEEYETAVAEMLANERTGTTGVWWTPSTSVPPGDERPTRRLGRSPASDHPDVIAHATEVTARHRTAGPDG